MAKSISLSDFKDPNVQIIAGAIVIALAVVGLTIQSGILPRIAETKVVSDSLAVRQQELNKIRNNENKLPTLQANVEQLEKELDSLEKFFPDKVDLPGFMSRITKVAREEQVVATSFTPKPPVTRQYFIENPYEITVIGAYHKLGAFFAQLANFDLIVNVSSMKLTSSSIAQKELSEYLGYDNYGMSYDNSINSTLATFQITTYSSLPPAPPATASTAPVETAAAPEKDEE